MTQPPPSGPQPSYGQPYGPPQPPYGPQFTPQYGPPGGYPPPAKKGNGCLIAGVLTGAVAVLAVAGIIVFFALRNNSGEPGGGSGTVAEGTQEPDGDETQEPEETTPPPPQGEFTETPECDAVEPDGLDEFVPGHTLSIDEVDTGDQEWWEGYHCTWDNADSSGDGSYYFLTVVTNDPDEYDTVDDLDFYAGDHETERVFGLGEGAVSWYDDSREVGCVATYIENLSISSCYDEMSDGEPLPEEEAIEKAEILAEATLEKIGGR
ncbi:hypothetical protein FOF52_10750 [Thermobifida alba]|uniref:DUF3558 domain-containing protein n=1 Tax=Thermobifida alba TaxID=53522 RepID=A0ABY4L515_THEAE|nr:hypothetical protein [Thermobifida alba]UPT21378.1 hypothetical protein FOF52_10750 [Thermobifida alba]